MRTRHLLLLILALPAMALRAQIRWWKRCASIRLATCRAPANWSMTP